MKIPRKKKTMQFFPLLLFSFYVLSCASSEKEVIDYGLIQTESITFSCDRRINQGMLLPVDIIYIQRFHMPGEVISLGPDQWFNHIEREKWEEKQTLSLKGGEEIQVKLNPLWMENTKFLIIFADFKDVNNPYSQQIILDESAESRVKILVMPSSLTPGRADWSWVPSCLPGF
jgi:hypothetical protein